MTRDRVLIIGISAVTGTCFAVLAGLSISAMVVTVRRFHIFSTVIAAGAICLAYLAFRMATASETDEETMVRSLSRGIIGAFIGLSTVILFLLMFGADTHGFLAHALGKSASALTTFRLLIASALLGFGAGFVVHMPSLRNDKLG